MDSEERHHHYIPQAYLRGFAQQRGRTKNRTFVTQVSDLRQLRAFESNVRNVGGERDFNRIDVAGHSPTAIEQEMSKLEGSCTAAMRRVVESGTFDGEDANFTLNLMAILAVRSPEQRESVREFQDQLHRKLLSLITKDEKTWRATTDGMKADGIAVNSTVSYEEARSFSQRGEFDIAVSREYHLNLEFKLAPAVLQQLGRRIWTLYTVDGSYGEFLTTDRPVTIRWTRSPTGPAFMKAPGFGLQNTEVLFPISRRAALIGRWDQGGVTEVGQRHFVAAFNSAMVQYSSERVFSASKQILYRTPQGEILEDEELLNNYKRWTGRA